MDDFMSAAYMFDYKYHKGTEVVSTRCDIKMCVI